MLVFAHALEIVVLLAAPWMIARAARKWHGAPVSWFWLGALAYIAAELLTLLASHGLELGWTSGLFGLPEGPRAFALGVALIGGFLSALTQELAKWVVLHRGVKERSSRAAIMVGLGHGGMESMLTGLLIALVFGSAVALHGANFQDLVAMGINERSAVRVGLRVMAWWEADPSAALLAGLRQLLVLLCQVGATAWVALGIARGRIALLGLAVIWHTLWAAGSVFAVDHFGPFVDVLIFAGHAIAASASIAYVMRQLETGSGELPSDEQKG